MKMDDSKLQVILDQAVQDGKTLSDNQSEERQKIWNYYECKKEGDFAPEAGKSSFVSSDVADAVDWIVPSVMRTFAGGDEIVEYIPARPDDEAFSEEATDYVNVQFREQDGYTKLETWVRSALMEPNGYVKAWWEEDKKVSERIYEGLDTESLIMMKMRNPDMEIVEIDDLGNDQYDVRVKTVKDESGIRFDTIPHEEFLISSDARTIHDAKLVAHMVSMTRSDLVQMGYDRETVSSIPSSSSSDDTGDKTNRFDGTNLESDADSDDWASQTVTVYECYLKVDYDGDGITELRCIKAAGNAPGLKILYNEPCDYIQIASITSGLMPHRFEGRSIAQKMMPIQLTKSVLVRQMLDNLYKVNSPRTKVRGEIPTDTYQRLFNHQTGDVLNLEQGDIENEEIPFVAHQTFPMLEFFDALGERRTGVNNMSTGLDAEALQNQSATAFNGAQAAAQAMIELMVRRFAETGIADFFKIILRLIVDNQKTAQTVRIRKEWRDVDPSKWSADMNVRVNTGLGSGSRERDMQMLQGILGIQMPFLQQMGPDNPFIGLAQVKHTIDKLIESAGLANADMFVGQIPPPQPPQQQQPDPSVIKAQADIHLNQQKAQADMQQKQADSQAKIAIEREKAAAQIEAAKQKAVLDAGVKRDELRTKADLEREKMEREAALKREELNMEFVLEREKMAAGSRDGQGNIARDD